MKWFRSHHGAPFDKKWPVVAKRAGVRVSEVAAVWWAIMDYASQQEDRGSIEGFDPEIAGVFFEIDTAAIQAVLGALEAKGSLNEKRVSNWEEYQPDETSTARVKRYRNDMKHDETKRNEIPSESVSESLSESKKEDDAEFAQFYAAYPRKQGKGQALKAFHAARKKADLATILQGIQRYVATKPDSQFIAMPATWLNGERWLDEPTPQTGPKPAKFDSGHAPTSFSDTPWRLRLKGYHESNFWLPSFGPKPGEPGCEVPKKILDEFSSLNRLKGAA